MKTIAIQDFLKQIPFLEALPAEHLEALAAAGKVLKLASGQEVFTQGDAAEHLYLILSGKLMVQGQTEQGREVLLSELDAGQFFGELALAEQGVRTASVRTKTEASVFQLSREAFTRLLGQAPELLSEVMGAISQKIRNANTQYFQSQLQKQSLQLQMQREHHQSVIRLIAGLATDVRQPLRRARELARDLELGLAGNSLLETSQELQQSLKQLQQLVQTFQAISAEQIEDQPEEINWQEVLENFQEIYAMTSDRHLPIEITLTPEAAHASWWGYPGVLQTVLLHLINNAETHAYPDQPGLVQIVISMRGQAAERWFELSFIDQGLGMSEDLIDQASKPFVTTRQQQGSRGLGLAVVESLVNGALGGHLDIHSTPGKGTRMILRIPVMQAA